jgi:hypothetical protein
MRGAIVIISLTLSFVVSGCLGDGGSQTASDCSAQVRAAGIIYTSHGYTDRKASRHSVADRADCDDSGEDAAGSAFSDPDPRVVVA